MIDRSSPDLAGDFADGKAAARADKPRSSNPFDRKSQTEEFEWFDAGWASMKDRYRGRVRVQR